MFPLIHAIAGGGQLGLDLGDPIGQACRFAPGRNTYLSRLLSIDGDRRTWTFRAWVKIGQPVTHTLFGEKASGSNDSFIAIGSNGQLIVFDQASAAIGVNLRTTRLLRDYAGWVEILVVSDTPNATAGDRVRVYVNGDRVTDFDTETYPAQNYQWTRINTASATQFVGTSATTATSEVVDGYMAEAIFVDGQALSPSSFGRVSVDTGEWVNRRYAGTFGPEGFHLDFADSANLGKDASGNGNDYASVGLVADDQVIDTPVDNYATMNPLSPLPHYALSEGNLRLVTSSDPGAPRQTAATFGSGTGKHVFEMTFDAATGGSIYLGVVFNHKVAPAELDDGIWYNSGSGNKRVGGVETAYGATWTTGDRIRVEVDIDGGQIEFFKNNVGQGPIAFTAGTHCIPSTLTRNSGTMTFEFGAIGFTDTPTAGFTPFNTSNLAEPVIINGRKQVIATYRLGTGAQVDIDIGFQPELIWPKRRDAVASHLLQNETRGTTNYLSSDGAFVEVSGGGVLQTLPDGYQLSNAASWNGSGFSFIDWNWKSGIVPGFAVVTYTGNGQAGRAIPHGLGIKPQYILVKSLTGARSWQVYHVGVDSVSPEQYRLILDQTNARQQSITYWNNQQPDATNFYLGTEGNGNAAGEDFVAYVWAPVPGFSFFGSYIGNGSTDGPFINCEFRPAVSDWKRADGVGDWHRYDSARSLFNPREAKIEINEPLAETVNELGDHVSNGLKVRAVGTDLNSNAAAYIVSAWAESPVSYARAV